jgi:hypothetical protein
LQILAGGDAERRRGGGEAIQHGGGVLGVHPGDEPPPGLDPFPGAGGGELGLAGAAQPGDRVHHAHPRHAAMPAAQRGEQICTRLEPRRRARDVTGNGRAGIAVLAGFRRRRR